MRATADCSANSRPDFGRNTTKCVPLQTARLGQIVQTLFDACPCVQLQIVQPTHNILELKKVPRMRVAASHSGGSRSPNLNEDPIPNVSCCNPPGRLTLSRTSAEEIQFHV